MEKAGTFNGQSFIEEVFNSLSHGVGALMAIAGFVWLMARSVYQKIMTEAGEQKRSAQESGEERSCSSR